MVVFEAIFLVSLVKLALGEDVIVSAMVEKDGNGNYDCKIVSGVHPDAAAVANWTDSVDTTGWALLDVKTVGDRSKFDDEALSFGVGCAQGFVSKKRAEEYWLNYVAADYGSWGEPSEELRQFLRDQADFVRTESRSQNTSFWTAVRHVMWQFDGLVEGYKAAGSTILDAETAYFLESVGDFETLNGVFPNPEVGKRAPDKDRFTDCSGLVKVTEDDVLVGHSTWRDYYAMLRMFASWTFSFAPAKIVTASSSPGFTHSKDDMYATGSKLIIFETTNSVFNATLLKDNITPKSVLTWQRAAAACMWATTPTEWTDIFAQYSSSTYNNQWVVVGGSVASPEFRVLEQTAGYVEQADLSSLLHSQTYWPSFNIPYFPRVFNLSGYPAMVQKYGDNYSYQKAPRHLIFNRNQTQVQDVSTLKNLMRYNDFQHDPLAHQDPVLGAIAARGDLDPSDPKPFGAVDSKVVSLKTLIQQGIVWQAISGPTNTQQKTFSFAQFPNVTRQGVPTVFDFPWITISQPI